MTESNLIQRNSISIDGKCVEWLIQQDRLRDMRFEIFIKNSKEMNKSTQQQLKVRLSHGWDVVDIKLRWQE